MSTFWDLLESSVIVSGFIALGCVGAVIYLSCIQQPIPDVLVNVVMIVVGFFFGGKVQMAAKHTASIMTASAKESRDGR